MALTIQKEFELIMDIACSAEECGSEFGPNYADLADSICNWLHAKELGDNYTAYCDGHFMDIMPIRKAELSDLLKLGGMWCLGDVVEKYCDPKVIEEVKKNGLAPQENGLKHNLYTMSEEELADSAYRRNNRFLVVDIKRALADGAGAFYVVGYYDNIIMADCIPAKYLSYCWELWTEVPQLTAVNLKRLRSKNSDSDIAYTTFVNEGLYSAEMLEDDLLKAGIQITKTYLYDHEKTCVSLCVFDGQPFSVGIEERRNGTPSSIIMFEADHSLMRSLANALGINEEECY